MSANPSINPSRFSRAVMGLCPIIERELSSGHKRELSEEELRQELIACILGSQVRTEMATAALARLDDAGLLGNQWWCDDVGDFESLAFAALSGGQVGADGRSYRFPRARAIQLADVRIALVHSPLTERLAVSWEAKRVRKHLANEIPGLGPKQSSMFLRNIGKSYDLAILDTHVIRFMGLLGMLRNRDQRLSSMRTYERVELTFSGYAQDVGYPVGYLDWAIWATMRAARELGL